MPKKISKSAISIHKIEYLIFKLNFRIKCKKHKKVKQVKKTSEMRIVNDIKSPQSFLSLINNIEMVIETIYFAAFINPP